jgi:hypothetical protein
MNALCVYVIISYENNTPELPIFKAIIYSPYFQLLYSGKECMIGCAIYYFSNGTSLCIVVI